MEITVCGLGWDTVAIVLMVGGLAIWLSFIMRRRRRTEEALAKSEENFRTLVENAPEAMYIQTNHRFVYVNAAAVRLFGASSADELLGTSSLDRIDPSFHAVIHERVRNLTVERKAVDLLEEVYLKVDGTPIEVEVSAVPFRYHDENGALVVFRDISRRKRVEEELRRNEAVLRSLLEATPAGVGLLVDRVHVRVNAALCRITGYSEEELIGTSTRVFYLDDEEFERVGRDVYGQMEREGLGVSETRLRRKDGELIDVLTCLRPFDPTDATKGVTATILDITERKRAEEALRESEGVFRDLAEKAVAGIYLIQDGRFKYVNARLADFFGYTVAEMIDQVTAEEVVHPEDRAFVAETIRQRLSGELRFLQTSFHILTKKGEVRELEIYSSGTLYRGRPAIIGTAVDVTDRRQAEEQLKASESMLRSVFHATPIGITFARDRILLSVNDAACRLLGYSREELVGRSARGFYMTDEEFEEAGREMYSRIRQEGQGSTEARFIRKDGTTMDVVLTGGMLREDDPSGGFVVTIQDVTEQKRAEDAVRQNEGVLRSLLEATPAGVALLVDRVFQRVNPALCRITGYSEEEIVGMKTRVLYPDEETFAQVGRELYEGMARTGLGMMETRLKRKSGDLIEVLLCLSPFDPRDADKGVTATVLDITERKRDEEEMRRLRNYLSNIINSMPSVLVGVDVNGCVTQWNAAAERATGVAAREAQGQPLDRVLPTLRRQLEELRQAMRTRTVSTQAKVPRIVDGELRYEDVTMYPLVSNGVEGAVIRVDDVTERVRIEEMMVQSEKMLSVGGLAAGMAHEINNPLGVILQASQNILRRVSSDLPVNAEVAEECDLNLSSLQQYLERREVLTFIEDIQQSGQRAAAIVANMLSFSRKADGGGTPTDLAQLLDRTVVLAASDYDLKKHYDFRQIDIVRDYQAETPQVICQAGKIQQVFLNILRNGAQAMGNAIAPDQAARFELRVFPDEDMVRVEIEDNGPGMDEATRKRVFEPFFTTKPPGSGTGLGLSVSYFIVSEEHGGTIAVESSPGAGSRFVVRLPIAGRVA